MDGPAETAPHEPQPEAPTVSDTRPDHAIDSPYRNIDRTDLEEFATLIAEGTWWREVAWRGSGGDERITAIRIISDDTVKDTLVFGKTARIVVVEVESASPPNSCKVLMVLAPTEPLSTGAGPWEAMLTVAGAFDYASLDYEVVDLGTERPRYALVITDCLGAMCMEAIFSSVYLYEDRGFPHRPELRRVFHEMTQMYGPEWGAGRWHETEIEFVDGDRELKDIAVSTRVERWHGKPDWHSDDAFAETEDYFKDLDERRTATFTWNGCCYEGEIPVGDVSEDMNWRH